MTFFEIIDLIINLVCADFEKKKGKSGISVKPVKEKSEDQLKIEWLEIELKSCQNQIKTFQTDLDAMKK